jgi:hypothetical protein
MISLVGRLRRHRRVCEGVERYHPSVDVEGSGVSPGGRVMPVEICGKGVNRCLNGRAGQIKWSPAFTDFTAPNLADLETIYPEFRGL